ncbi:hypothetical protein BHM03_00061375 [Ensete ventricosum]|nr:hypothetical protein BHM03_00061375 [Ensete ventricosum]
MVEDVESSNGYDRSSKGHLSVVEEFAILSVDNGRNCTWSGGERKLRALARLSYLFVDDRGRLSPLRLRARSQCLMLGFGKRPGGASLKRIAWSTHEALRPRLASLEHIGEPPSAYLNQYL